MSYINDITGKYSKEYEQFGKKIIEENKVILQKAGVIPPIFNSDTKNTETDAPVIKKTSEKDKEEKSKETKKKKSYTETSIEKNQTLSDVKSSSGFLNTVYKKIVRTSNYHTQNDSDSLAADSKELLSSLEETNGSDDNDDMENFMSSEYPDGVHINGGGYVYVESDDDNVTDALNAKFAGTYKTKDEKITLSYSGSVEYSHIKDKSNNNSEQEQTAILPDNISGGSSATGNAVLMAKYKTPELTYAGGGTVNVYDDDSKLYNIYAGVLHKSGIAATLRRKIQVTLDEEGKTITENQTDIKLNFLKPKKADTPQADVPDIPSPDETKEDENLVNSEKQEVEEITKSDSYGWKANLKLSTSSSNDEYGIEFIRPTLITKKEDENKKIVVTPFLGVYDYHPNTDEGLKVRTGVMGTLSFKSNNNLEISSRAIIDNKRIMQHGSSPVNTFMATLDTTVSKNKLSGTVLTGYINSSSAIKYSFATLSLQYKMKNSSLELKAGCQDISGNNIKHAGVRYAANF